MHLEIYHVYIVTHSTERAAHWPKAVYLNFHKVFTSSITNHSEIKIKTLPKACFLPFRFKNPRFPAFFGLTGKTEVLFSIETTRVKCCKYHTVKSMIISMLSFCLVLIKIITFVKL